MKNYPSCTELTKILESLSGENGAGIILSHLYNDNIYVKYSKTFRVKLLPYCSKIFLVDLSLMYKLLFVCLI